MHGETSFQDDNAETSESHTANFSTASDLPDPLSIATPLGVDHTVLWDKVFSACCSDIAESPSTTGSPGSHASFVSQPDSDVDAQPVEEYALPYNPATFGLKIDVLLHERSTVERVINGWPVYLSIVAFCTKLMLKILAPNSLTPLQRGDINTFDFLVKSKVSVDTYHAMQDTCVLKQHHSSLPLLKSLRT